MRFSFIISEKQRKTWKQTVCVYRLEQLRKDKRRSRCIDVTTWNEGHHHKQIVLPSRWAVGLFPPPGETLRWIRFWSGSDPGSSSPDSVNKLLDPAAGEETVSLLQGSAGKQIIQPSGSEPHPGLLLWLWGPGQPRTALWALGEGLGHGPHQGVLGQVHP